MKVLVIGGGGMLGHKLVQVFTKNFETWTTLRRSLDEYEPFGIFTEKNKVKNIDVENLPLLRTEILKIKPDVIVNAVGVIKQLPSSKNIIKTLTLNTLFPHQLSEIAAEINARLITISTDCVFSGKRGNYVETDLPDADDLYGKSKYLGEVLADNCLTIRTSIIGRELNTSHSLVEWFLSHEGKNVKGYRKAIFSGFPTIILAEIIAGLITNFPKLNGLFHISSEPISKFKLLELIRNAFQANIEIEPFDDFQIDRSLDSTKFREATGFKPLEWKKMIDILAADNLPYKNKI
jgi:dTDP-4-dehydrorhamnose reductase